MNITIRSGKNVAVFLFFNHPSCFRCSHVTTKSCLHSDGLPKDNLCDKAHSQDELEEWIVRVRYRKEKMKMAQKLEDVACKYIDELLEGVQNSSSDEMVSIFCGIDLYHRVLHSLYCTVYFFTNVPKAS